MLVGQTLLLYTESSVNDLDLKGDEINGDHKPQHAFQSEAV